MRAELEVVSGPGSGTVIALNEPRFLIGRERDCQLRLESALVSRHHVVIKRDDFMLRVRDMGSRNGSFVNGRKVVGEVVLNDGDSLQFGDVTVLVRISNVEASNSGRNPQTGRPVDGSSQQTSVYDGGTIVTPPQGYPQGEPPRPQQPMPQQGGYPQYQPQYAPPPAYYPPAPAYAPPPPVMYPGYPPAYAPPPPPQMQPYYPPVPGQPYPPNYRPQG